MLNACVVIKRPEACQNPGQVVVEILFPNMTYRLRSNLPNSLPENIYFCLGT